MADVRHSPLTWRFFETGFTPFRRSLLRPTRVGGSWPTGVDGTPLLLLANHVSWWDGFLLREVQRRIRPTSPFHTVVVDHQIAQYPMLGRLGGVPVDPSSVGSVRGMIRTLSRLRRDDPETVFAYFPQGRVWPTSRRPLSVRRGIGAVTRALAPIRVLPVAIHIEPVTAVRPTPFVWLGDPVDVPTGEHLAAATVDQMLTIGLDEIRSRLDQWGEDIVRAWPDAVPPKGRMSKARSRVTDAAAEGSIQHTTPTPRASP